MSDPLDHDIDFAKGYDLGYKNALNSPAVTALLEAVEKYGQIPSADTWAEVTSAAKAVRKERGGQ